VLKLAQKEPDIVLIALGGSTACLNRATRFGQVHFLDKQGQPAGNLNSAHFAERVGNSTLLSVTRLQVELYESIVPRSAAHPDGLLIGQFTSHTERMDPAAPSREAPAHAP
jgi:hypothetical protein